MGDGVSGSVTLDPRDAASLAREMGGEMGKILVSHSCSLCVCVSVSVSVCGGGCVCVRVCACVCVHT